MKKILIPLLLFAFIFLPTRNSETAIRLGNGQETNQSGIVVNPLSTRQVNADISTVLLLRMNDNAGNTTVVDSSGQGNNGTAQQNTSVLHTDGKIGGALTFNGTSDYINLGTPSSLMGVTYPLTISAWVKPDTLSQDGVIVSLQVTDADSTIVFGMHNTSNSIFVGRITYKYGLSGISSYLTAIKWQNWVIVFKSTTDIDFYLDGVKQTLSDISNYYSAKKNNIGARDNGVSGPFDGTIDEVAIYNRVLTPIEIRQHYMRNPKSMQ